MFRYNIQTRVRIVLCAVLALVGISVAFTSCVSERTDDLHISEEDGKLLELTLIPRTEQTTTATLRSHVGEEPGDKENGLHGGAQLNENKIDNIELFVFDPATGDQLVGRYTPSKQEALPGGGIGSRATFIIPKDDLPKLEGKQLDYISVVNASKPIDTSVTTKAALYELIQDDQSKLNPAPQSGKIAPQDKFLMDGVLQKAVTWGKQVPSTNLGTIDLYRAAAKIRLRIDHIDVKNRQNGIETAFEVKSGSNPEVCLIHYTEKTKVVRSTTSPYQTKANEWHNSAYRPMVETDFTALGYTSSKVDGKFYGTVPFYAYEHDWRTVSTNETYLRLKLTMRPKGAAATDPWVDYYYRIPVNYRKALGDVTDEMLHKLERNHLYDVLTSIEVLGSLNEDTPVDIIADIAIKPWNLIESVDGDLLDAQYLEVYNKSPIMAATDKVKVPYASSLRVEIQIDSVWYEYYDVRGVHYRREFSKTESKLYKINGSKTEVPGGTRVNAKPWDGIVITPSANYLSNGEITIQHPVPVNYIPYHIKFTVKQKEGGPLSQEVRVLQYPHRYVSGTRSGRFSNGKDALVDADGRVLQSPVYADFRFQTLYGSFGRYQGDTKLSPQIKEINFKITTVVPQNGELIGSPVDPKDPKGKTKTDAASNKLISPQFIIASQYGMSTTTYQRLEDVPSASTTLPRKLSFAFSAGAPGYGPLSTNFWGAQSPYLNVPYDRYLYRNSDGLLAKNQNIACNYWDAETRCQEYFEGEYGTDGTYVEHYVDETDNWASRRIRKTFKHQGRWRIPTSAEMKIIDRMQGDPNTEIRGLLFGLYYWVAEKGKVYDFTNHKVVSLADALQGLAAAGKPQSIDGAPNIYVRPIFDTYMYEEDK
ncbi:fimbrial tip adhesin FimD [Porphyromonas asaccharolytica]